MPLECRRIICPQLALAYLYHLYELIRDLLAPTTPTPYKRPHEAIDAVLSSIIMLAELPDGTSADHAGFPVPQVMKDRCHDWLLHSLAYAEITDTHNYCTGRQRVLLEELKKVDTAGVIQSRAAMVEYARAHNRHMREIISLVNSEAQTHGSRDGQTEGASEHEVQTRGTRQGDDSDPQPPAPRAGLHQRAGHNHVGMAAISAGDYGLTRMRLFRSARGWVGKGPQSLRVGDEVWIVPGAKVAFVLRMRGRGRRVFVGHAYVHGIMGGEAREQFRGRQMEAVVLE